MNDFTGKIINANLIDGLQVLQGKLCFYEDGYIYKAGGVNSIICQDKILYSQIESVKRRNTLGIVSNGITVCLKNKSEIKYVVTNREKVIAFLQKRINDIAAENQNEKELPV